MSKALYFLFNILIYRNIIVECVTIIPKNTNVEPYQQLQNLITSTFKGNTTRKDQPAEPVLPWKKSTTVLEYHNILHFSDESEFLNNHICYCHIEKIPEDGLNRILNNFIT